MYTPQRKQEKKIKQAFYEKLEEICEKMPKQDILMLVGDFNAQIGRELRY